MPPFDAREEALASPDVTQLIAAHVAPGDQLAWSLTRRSFRDARRSLVGGPPMRTKVSDVAGSRARAAWAYGSLGLPLRSLMKAAARLGSEEVVSFAMANGESVIGRPELGMLAAASGSLGLLEMLCAAGAMSAKIPSFCAAAASRGHLHALRWLHDKGFCWDASTPAMAGARGNLDCLQFARQEGCPWDDRTTSASAKRGDLESLQYAAKEGCPIRPDVAVYAARDGDIEMLKHEPHIRRIASAACIRPCEQRLGLRRRSHGLLVCLIGLARDRACRWVAGWMGCSCVWNADVCAAAAQTGQLNTLMWLREVSGSHHQADWDGETCAAAASGGHLAVLQWARENGCPWDERTCLAARAAGHKRVLDWARARGCPG